MNIRDAGNLKAFFLILYLLFALLFTGGLIAAGQYVQNRYQGMAEESVQLARQTASLRVSLSEARTVAEDCAFMPVVPENAKALLMRTLFSLESTAKKLEQSGYSRSLEYRHAIQSVSEASLNARKASSFTEQLACLRAAEKGMFFLETSLAGENERLSIQLQKTYWLFAGIVLSFSTLSFVLLFTAFTLIGRALHSSLCELSSGTREFRKGNMNYRFRNITSDEIGQAKYDFNIMAHRISDQAKTLHAANLELKEQAEKLLAAHQHKDRFLSNMSHELRTPLSSIIGFAELLDVRADKITPDKIRSYAKHIQSASEHLFNLITSLLDLAKSGAGVLKPVFSDFDLSAAIQEMTDILKPLADKKNLALNLYLPHDAVVIHADQRMIKQIFVNLCGNAIKYTQTGSVEIMLERKGRTVVLAVKDTGIGIPESEHKNLFTDFYRVDNGPDFLYDGVGIGLALSRRLAALHQGKITFKSKAGQGSTFYFTLPAPASDRK